MAGRRKTKKSNSLKTWFSQNNGKGWVDCKTESRGRQKGEASGLSGVQTNQGAVHVSGEEEDGSTPYSLEEVVRKHLCGEQSSMGLRVLLATLWLNANPRPRVSSNR